MLCNIVPFIKNHLDSLQAGLQGNPTPFFHLARGGSIIHDHDGNGEGIDLNDALPQEEEIPCNIDH